MTFEIAATVIILLLGLLWTTRDAANLLIKLFMLCVGFWGLLSVLGYVV